MVIDKQLFKEDGTQVWNAFQQNIGQNYIVDKVLGDMRKIESQFATDVGIPNTNLDKKERMITDEVNANNIETITRCELWLEQLKKSAEETKAMFGINVSVDWRHDQEEMIVTNQQEGEYYYGKNR